MTQLAGIEARGLIELDQMLAELPKATQRNVLRRALMRQAAPLAEDMRRAVPVFLGNLRESITVTQKPPAGTDKSGAVFRAALTDDNSLEQEFGIRRALDYQTVKGNASLGQDYWRRQAGAAVRVYKRANKSEFARIWVGPGRHPQAHMVEFGSVNNQPKPYVRPAWDRRKGSILTGINSELRREIDKSLARYRRAQAKAGARA